MSQSKQCQEIEPNKFSLKWFGQQIWQMLILLLIAGFSCGSVYTALGLKDFATDGSSGTAIMIMVMFAVAMFFLADFIWAVGFKKVTGYFWCEKLAYGVFFLFCFCGLISFGLFFYAGYTFWWGDIFSLRVLPILSGCLLFVFFLYKFIFRLSD